MLIWPLPRNSYQLFTLIRKDLESFLEEDGVARFEALVKKVQGSDAYPASAKFYPYSEGKIHGIYHLAQGVKTICQKNR